VLAVARSNVSGVAILKEIKLRVKPGVYYVEIKAPDFRNITPAEVRKEIRLGDMPDVFAGRGMLCCSFVMTCLHTLLLGSLWRRCAATSQATSDDDSPNRADQPTNTEIDCVVVCVAR
jgi:hypothetical protein